MIFNKSKNTITIRNPKPLQICKFAYQTQRAVIENKPWDLFVKEDDKIEIRTYMNKNEEEIAKLKSVGEPRLCAESISYLEEYSKNVFSKHPIAFFKDHEVSEILGVRPEADHANEMITLRNKLQLWDGTLISAKFFNEFLLKFQGGFSMHNYICFLDYVRLLEFYPRNETCPIHASFSQKIYPFYKIFWDVEVNEELLNSIMKRNSANCFNFLSEILQNHAHKLEGLFQHQPKQG